MMDCCAGEGVVIPPRTEVTEPHQILVIPHFLAVLNVLS